MFRYFHASPGPLSRNRGDEEFGLKTRKKEKYAKRQTKAPVEAPYVPPKPKGTTKALLDRTIDIFEGMTIGELAKRSNESISTLQEILINVGEKVDSEFDTLSIDIAELVAMVSPPPQFWKSCNTPLSLSLSLSLSHFLSLSSYLSFFFNW